MDINRRRFLFGMGAAAAVAAMPFAAGIVEPVIAAPPAAPFLKRLITKVAFNSMDTGCDLASVMLELRRAGTATSLFNAVIAYNMLSYSWVPMPGNEIIALPHSPA